MNATQQTVWRCSNPACGKTLPLVEVKGEASIKCRYCKTVNMIRSPRVTRIAN